MRRVAIGMAVALAVGLVVLWVGSGDGMKLPLCGGPSVPVKEGEPGDDCWQVERTRITWHQGLEGRTYGAVKQFTWQGACRLVGRPGRRDKYVTGGECRRD